MAADNQNSEAPAGRPLRKQGEEAIGKLAQGLLESPLVSSSLTAVFETRERATRAQEVAMSALNLPSAADIERLTRRVRSVAQRIEGVEDNLDRIVDKLEKVGRVSALEERLTAIETALERIEKTLADAPAATPTPQPAATRAAASRAAGKPAAAAKPAAAKAPAKPRATKPKAEPGPNLTGAGVADMSPVTPADES